jgi:transposase-like protein
MSPKKITDADKLEIVARYRQTKDTAAALATRYGVSNSTIGRLLKTSIPEAEYELLIQQKRGARGSNDDDNVEMTANTASKPTAELDRNLLAERVEDDRDPALEIAATAAIDAQKEAASPLAETVAPAAPNKMPMEEKSAIPSTPTPPNLDLQPLAATQTSEQSGSKRLVRRRSSTRQEESTPTVAAVNSIDAADFEEIESASTARTASVRTSLDPDFLPTVAEIPPSTEKPAPQMPRLRDLSAERSIELVDETAIDDDSEDSERESEDVNALAAMFGEEIADSEDEDEDDDDDDDWDEQTIIVDRADDRDLLLTGNRTYLQVTPLSQATLPRTCYIAIDKFAEPIVRPLKDFAELGQIPAEEIQQRTLPVFDNHRVAKRFSKIPDSRIFQKTIAHMRAKGIARLLVDGNIYSLN